MGNDISKDSSNNSQYRPYRTDRTPDYFTLMQQERGFVFEDALAVGGTGEVGEAAKGVQVAQIAQPDQVQTLFFPGCSFASYSGELTQAVYGFLKERKLVDGMSTQCCGHILYFSAEQKVFRSYTEAFRATLKAHGVIRIITACPNCYASLQETLSGTGIEVVALSEVLVDEGMRVVPEHIAPTTTVCIHDSCPDRELGVFGPTVRRLFENIELREMEHNHEKALCCGLGRLLFISSPIRSEKLRKKRIEEFASTQAELLVTYCFSCDNAFQDPGRGISSVHYLELLFGIRVDWDAVEKSAQIALKTFDCGSEGSEAGSK
jgi:Fe-S oxidoreductase